MMLSIILLGVLLACITPLLCRVSQNQAPKQTQKHIPSQIGWLLAVYPILAFYWFVTQYPSVASGQAVIERIAWMPSLGIDLAFKLDGLSLLFAFLITGIGAVVLIYAGTYMRSYERAHRFFMALLLFMASMLGLVLSDNLISLFVFWELTSLTSYFLIGFTHEKVASRVAALKALIVTAGGGLALLAGFILLGISAGTYDISQVLSQREALTTSPLLSSAMVLIIIGCFSKSAQFPFQFWLPAAMAAPSPVSAYLHSATMVKAGVYLLARMSPLFDGQDGWNATLMTFGGITLLIGASVAIIQSDLKSLLANTTVSALGLLTMLIGIGSSYAIHAAMIFILAHALYKGALFLLTGVIEKQTGTRNVWELGRLVRDMPLTALAAIIACLSMAGLPPLFGFIGKEYTYVAVLNLATNAPLTTSAFFVSGAFFMVAALLIGYRVCIAKPYAGRVASKDPAMALLIGPLLMAVLSLVLAIASDWVTPLLNQAALAVNAQSGQLKISLWHGFNLPLVLSILTLLVGFLIFLFIAIRPDTMRRITISDSVRISHAYDEIMQGIIDVSKIVTRIIQHGYLRMYIFTIIVTFCVLALWVLKDFSIPAVTVNWQDFRVYDILLGLVMIAACFYAVAARSRLLAIALLGVVGYGVAFIFIMFGAPDLAITQILVETLTVVIFVLVLWKLPKYLVFNQRAIPFRYLVVSILFGAIMTWVTMLVTQYPLESHLKSYFGENSYLLAKGKNVVNVILVDFRSLDTLGEIVVLGIAAIGVYALVKLSKPTKQETA